MRLMQLFGGRPTPPPTGNAPSPSGLASASVQNTSESPMKIDELLTDSLSKRTPWIPSTRVRSWFGMRLAAYEFRICHRTQGRLTDATEKGSFKTLAHFWSRAADTCLKTKSQDKKAPFIQALAKQYLKFNGLKLNAAIELGNADAIKTKAKLNIILNHNNQAASANDLPPPYDGSGGPNGPDDQPPAYPVFGDDPPPPYPGNDTPQAPESGNHGDDLDLGMHEIFQQVITHPDDGVSRLIASDQMEIMNSIHENRQRQERHDLMTATHNSIVELEEREEREELEEAIRQSNQMAEEQEHRDIQQAKARSLNF